MATYFYKLHPVACPRASLRLFKFVPDEFVFEEKQAVVVQGWTVYRAKDVKELSPGALAPK